MSKFNLLPALMLLLVILTVGPAQAADSDLLPAETESLVLYGQAETLEPTDPRKALSLFCQAARNGHGPSQLRVAAYYLQGLIVEEDLAAAMLWADMAALNGVNEGRELRKTVGRLAKPDDFTRYRYYNNNRTILPCAGGGQDGGPAPE